jgi:hypothetical protein
MRVNLNFLLGWAELSNMVMMSPQCQLKDAGKTTGLWGSRNPRRMNAPFADLEQRHIAHVLTNRYMSLLPAIVE